MVQKSQIDDQLSVISEQLVKGNDNNPLAELIEKAQRSIELSRNCIKAVVFLSYTVGALATIVGYTSYKAVTNEREYFGLDNGRIIPLSPLSQPYRNSRDTINFTRDGLTALFSLSWSDYRRNIESAKPWFTLAGLDAALKELKEKGYLDKINDKVRMNLTVSVGTGVIVKEGLLNGKYVRIVEVPLSLRLVGGTSQYPEQKLIARITVVRIPTSVSSEGIAISNIITKPSK
ncbi:DotI/IcmL/TraM family protein [Xenorhabdus nematophila]|uniref:DotI/IcmL/TraM family protein n=1 Tax=Xenorhabdus nematophila TaxID=628 RepID=UPI0032B82FAA